MTTLSRLKHAAVAIAAILANVVVIVLADRVFHETLKHTFWLRRCLPGDPWQNWGPIFTASGGLFCLAVLSIVATRSLPRGIRGMVLIPLLLYSLWLGLWGLVDQVPGPFDRHPLSTPTLIPLVQGLTVVFVQLSRRGSVKRGVGVLALLLLVGPTLWLVGNYVMGRSLCG